MLANTMCGRLNRITGYKRAGLGSSECCRCSVYKLAARYITIAVTVVVVVVVVVEVDVYIHTFVNREHLSAVAGARWKLMAREPKRA